MSLQHLDDQHEGLWIVRLSRLIHQVVDLAGEVGDAVSHTYWSLRISTAVRAAGVFLGILHLGPAELIHWW